MIDMSLSAGNTGVLISNVKNDSKNLDDVDKPALAGL